MKHLFYIDRVIHDPGLSDICWDPVQHQRVNVRLELVRFYRRIDRLSPKLHRNIVWDELAFARILKESFAEFCAGVDGAEHIATSAVIVTRDRAERLALGALAAARRATKKKSVISHHHGNRLYSKSTPLDKPHSERSRGTPTVSWSTESLNPTALGTQDDEVTTGSTLTRRPLRSKRTFPSTNAKIV